MKVQVIRRFYDATTKKPYTLRKPGEVYSCSKERGVALAKGGFVRITEEEIEQPTAVPETETKAKPKAKSKTKK